MNEYIIILVEEHKYHIKAVNAEEALELAKSGRIRSERTGLGVLSLEQKEKKPLAKVIGIDTYRRKKRGNTT